MAKSKTFRFLIIMFGGLVAIFLSLHFVLHGNNTSIIFSVEESLLPHTIPPVAAVPLKETRKNSSLMLSVLRSLPPAANRRFFVTLVVNPSGTPINAVDAVIVYPTDLLRLVTKDESISPFAFRLNKLSDKAGFVEVIQVQPNPGINASTSLARFTFVALKPGIATIRFLSSSQVLANDGFGTDVLDITQDASLTIQ